MSPSIRYPAGRPHRAYRSRCSAAVRGAAERLCRSATRRRLWWSCCWRRWHGNRAGRARWRPHSHRSGSPHCYLTPAEARVARGIAQGLSPARIAKQLGVSPQTIRSQLKRVFVKTSTNRQTELSLLSHAWFRWFGCPARIRTLIDGVRVRSLTIRGRGNGAAPIRAHFRGSRAGSEACCDFTQVAIATSNRFSFLHRRCRIAAQRSWHFNPKYSSCGHFLPNLLIATELSRFRRRAETVAP